MWTEHKSCSGLSKLLQNGDRLFTPIAIMWLASGTDDVISISNCQSLGPVVEESPD